jgi:hypothetical protein
MNTQYLINELRRYHKEFDESPTFRSFAKASTYPAPITVVKAFGTWNAGLTAAQLPHRQERYDTKNLFEWIQQFRLQHGRDPKHREIPNGIRQGLMTAYGTIKKALAAKYTPNNLNESKLPTTQQLAKAVKRFISKHKRNPSLTDISELGYRRFHFIMHGGIAQFWSSKYPSTNIFTTYAHYIADDGHICFSKCELLLDNFLTKHKIPHDKEVCYMFDKKLNPKGNLRCDFVIHDVYVEFAGMYKNTAYDARLERKKLLAKKAGHKFLVLYINDLMTNGHINTKRLLSLLITK